jgi:HTH-type transcriptional regulator/antitoxin HigA
MLDAYESIKHGRFGEAVSKWKHEPGVVLIIARIARGLSQAELANRLNMREQQIQRYEAERYKSISLQSLRRVATVLGVQIEAGVSDGVGATISALKVPSASNIDDRQLKAIAHHAEKSGWFPISADDGLDKKYILDYISDSMAQFGSPGLLRTGLKSLDLKDDAMLAVWRARVLERAVDANKKIEKNFDQTNLEWITKLVKISADDDAPSKAIELCRANGVQVIVEPQIQGLKLDGAAFLCGLTPVIGLTVRHDRVDNFWYTLLHEMGHVFLHFGSGLAAGFFDDDLDHSGDDDVEKEADQFASSMLVPPERWRQSTVRITRSAATVEQFARQVEIHPAIVFGRLRRERNDYSLFSDRVGSGQIRHKLLMKEANSGRS